ncbi:MAG TPA: hypothetical protein VEP90_04170 [Methylomirabilota bacterium]|nr:hypothetical protein [Methylomirabilota bacterium]
MKPHKKYLLVAGLSIFLFASTGIVYASSSTFFTQAQKFINQNCNKKILADQTALLCYLFNKSQEQDTSITTINATLSPIPTQIQNLQNQQGQSSQNISSLQSSTSTLAASIETLKSSQGKAIHVLDANNQDLGLLIDGGTVFNTTLSLIIPIDTSSGYVGLHDPYAYYTTSNCTGTPYYPTNYVGYLIQMNGTYMKVDTSSPSLTLTVHSDHGLSEPLSNCYPASGTMSNLYTITQVNNPYQNPVTLPLQYKYQ